jgi:two-component system catabolic regulation response regulator CreB/two-component system response regulator ChvI
MVSNNNRIFIVDDESDTCLALERILEENGFKVDKFTDPFLALKNFKADFYGMLILDIKMPKMNGFELYLEIKKMASKEIKVMFLTAVSEYQQYEAFRKMVLPKLGQRHFVSKPIVSEELVRRVNYILSKNK